MLQGTIFREHNRNLKRRGWEVKERKIRIAGFEDARGNMLGFEMPKKFKFDEF